MAKFGVLKKITALATAIALVVCFAVSASAISVVTTTTYDREVAGEVEVTVTVTGTAAELPVGANVTYYATKGGADVHIDQTQVLTAGTATFAFNTVESNLKSNALVGYTGATEANDDSTITGYTVTYPGNSQVVPTGVETITFNYDLPAGKVFKNVAVTSGTATVTGSYADGTVTVNFSAISSDVTLAVNVEGDTGAVTAAAEFVDAGALTVGEGFVKEAVYVDGELDEDFAAANADAAGDRKLTVIGKATSAANYGIIVDDEAIVAGTYTAAQFAALAGDKYAAAGKDDATGMFAVQLIDTSSEGEAWVAAATTYQTAVYVEDANGCFVVVAGDEVATTVTE